MNWLVHLSAFLPRNVVTESHTNLGLWQALGPTCQLAALITARAGSLPSKLCSTWQEAPAQRDCVAWGQHWSHSTTKLKPEFGFEIWKAFSTAREPLCISLLFFFSFHFTLLVSLRLVWGFVLGFCTKMMGLRHICNKIPPQTPKVLLLHFPAILNLPTNQEMTISWNFSSISKHNHFHLAYLYCTEEWSAQSCCKLRKELSENQRKACKRPNYAPQTSRKYFLIAKARSGDHTERDANS